MPAGEIEGPVTEQIQGLSAGSADATFAAWWAALPALAQAQVVQHLIERVDYDGIRGTVAIRFAADAASALAEQQALGREETNT